MPALAAILFGFLLTAATCLALGRTLIRSLGLGFHRHEESLIAFVTGAALLSFLVFCLAAVGLARREVFLAAGLAAIAAALRRDSRRPPAKPLPALSRFWKTLFGVIFAVFLFLYAANAMAPEVSPDGSNYHLRFVALYFRQHGFTRVTTHLYAQLGQGMEMLYLFAFAFGKHSAAAMMHLAFLVTLPLAMLSYARRFDLPAGVGVCGALVTFASPVVGIDGVSAYNDVAVATVAFTLFYLLQIWAATREPGLLFLIGLTAGFGFALKLTAGLGLVYALGFAAWRLWRKRERMLRPLAVITAGAVLIGAPWTVKSWILTSDPLSPFLNRLFPNPYVHLSTEQSLAEYGRTLHQIHSYREVPWQAAVKGQLEGTLGPVFLLAPLALLALARPAGRQLLLAAAVFFIPAPAQVTTRFLIPCVPFLALSMALALGRWPPLLAVLALAHALLSWPSLRDRWLPSGTFAIGSVPVRAALRIDSEESFLNARLDNYAIIRAIEQMTPPGSRIFAFSALPDAYTSREILVGWQAAFNEVLNDILWTPLIPERQPTWRQRFRFAPEKLRAIRVVQTARGRDFWSASELRVFRGGQEIPRTPRWKLLAHPNPWEVQLAFDDNPVTRWSTWQPLYPGMYLEVDFDPPQPADAVLAECSNDQGGIRLKLEGRRENGRWSTLSSSPEVYDGPPFGGTRLRRLATEEVARRNVRYLVIRDDDFGAQDFRQNAGAWGIEPLAERNGIRLYRIR